MLASLTYLFLSLLLFTSTLGIIRPRAYGRWLAPLAALPSMILAIFLPQLMLIGLWLTAVVGWLGGLRTTPGRWGLLLHLVSWGLLLLYQWRTYSALPVLDGRPVADTDHPFGDRLSEEERAALRAGRISLGPHLTWRVPSMGQVEVLTDVVFREVDGVRLRADVYRPRRRAGPLPGAIYLHGGGWIAGTRRQSRIMLYELAAAGWVVFAVSYRFAPRFPLPAAIHDAKAAVAWVGEHGAGYGALPGPPVVLGGSAGGHLAAMLALTANDPRFQPGFEAADTRVRGAVVLYGVTDIESLFGHGRHRGAMMFFERVVFRSRYRDDPSPFRLAQPLSHLSAGAPPLLLVHGRNDGLVPFEQSRTLHDRLRAAGASQVHLLEIPFGLHAFEIAPSPMHQRTVRVIVRFMESLRPRDPN